MSPQLENGFTRIANELLQAFYLCKMTEYERVVCMYVWRKTYGWGKKEDWISNSQFSEGTGIARSHITRTLKMLVDKKVVNRRGNKLSVNKNYQEWVIEWRKLPHQVTGVTSPGNKKLPHQVPTKESKETIQKGEQSSQKENMFNKHSEDYLSGDIDFDGDGTIEDPEAITKEQNARRRKMKNEMIDWLIDWQGRDPKRVNRPSQLKALNELIHMNVSPGEIKQIIKESEVDDYFKSNNLLPDFHTVVKRVQKRRG